MPSPSTTRVIENLRRAVLRDAEPGDGELLGRFIEHRDDAALAALIHRHGPMVWGVCRRLLSHHDAEDAFQAAFVVLVRKASSVSPRGMVGNWLYGVAHRAALLARRSASRRKSREAQMTVLPDAETAAPEPAPEAQLLLDEELSRLPDYYRAVVVLCDLEGRTRKEAAEQLQVPVGTVAGRLARARSLLAKRLARRGVTGALAIAPSAATAIVPDALVSSTIRSATLIATGSAGLAGTFTPEVASLTEGVLKAMLLSKLKILGAIVLALGFLTTAATVDPGRTAAGESVKQPATAKPAPTPQKGEKLAPATEAKLKWGEPVDGLRAAMAIRLAPGRAKTDKPDLYMALQNVSKEPIRITDADVPKDVNLRLLLVRKDGKILYGLGTREPGLGERLLQPREVTFLPMFDPDTKLDVPTKNGDTIGSDHAGQAIQDARMIFTGEFTIEKAPAKTWKGKLITGESSGTAAEIKAEVPEKKAPRDGEKGKMKAETLSLQIIGPAKLIAAGDDIAMEVILSTEGEESHTFQLGAFPQVFGVYVLGPWGVVQPDPTRSARRTG